LQKPVQRVVPVLLSQTFSCRWTICAIDRKKKKKRKTNRWTGAMKTQWGETDPKLHAAVGMIASQTASDTAVVLSFSHKSIDVNCFLNQ